MWSTGYAQSGFSGLFRLPPPYGPLETWTNVYDELTVVLARAGSSLAGT